MRTDLFDLSGRVAVITGGYGVLGGVVAEGLLQHGAAVAILGRRREPAETKAAELRTQIEDESRVSAVVADVTVESELRSAREEVLRRHGQVDILINAAGGNTDAARTDNRSIFDLSFDAFDEVVELNLHGSVYPTLVLGEAMADRGRGSIVNISSMASERAISGAMGYSVAKAAIDNFTRWMAVDTARRHGEGLRVNAVAPGFFITKQNRNLLLRTDGSLTDRSRTIIERTPVGRFGEPDELVGTVVWLCSNAAAFVTGIVVPVDGGFSAFSGV